LDKVEPTQVILMKDPVTGKILVQAAYRVKAGNEVVKTVPGRSLVSSSGPAQTQQSADLLSSTEKAAATAAWDAVQAALQRLELG
jgi:hypothetical protein